jgi:hypothetical protein
MTRSGASRRDHDSAQWCARHEIDRPPAVRTAATLSLVTASLTAGLVARARDHRRVPVRPAPRRHPRTRRAVRHRGRGQGNTEELLGWHARAGRAAFVDDLEGVAPDELARKGRIVAARHHRQIVSRSAGRMKPARSTPAGLTDVPFALVCGSGDIPADPPGRRTGDREDRATWRPGASCPSGPPAAGRLPR